ncbi:uncharacterized protein LOC142589914 isoform X6 [Dermacentor variabilis]|uniref:uncharacterized protein LOC142589914 isoform X6 n=1 Tax=Dermacentor variabilis TaxID=34621 RepID=UPI003F5C4759
MRQNAFRGRRQKELCITRSADDAPECCLANTLVTEECALFCMWCADGIFPASGHDSFSSAVHSLRPHHKVDVQVAIARHQHRRCAKKAFIGRPANDVCITRSTEDAPECLIANTLVPEECALFCMWCPDGIFPASGCDGFSSAVHSLRPNHEGCSSVPAESATAALYWEPIRHAFGPAGPWLRQEHADSFSLGTSQGRAMKRP